MYPRYQNNFSSQQRNTYDFTQNNNKSPNDLRNKKIIYTVLQIFLVIILLASLPMVVIGIINVVPRIGQTAKTDAVITKISDDFGAIIDESTKGKTALSNGCNISYEFQGNQGLAHSQEYCSRELGSKIPITYDPTKPSRNSVDIDTSQDAIIFWVGLAMLLASLVAVIVVSVRKNQLIQVQRSI